MSHAWQARMEAQGYRAGTVTYGAVSRSFAVGKDVRAHVLGLFDMVLHEAFRTTVRQLLDGWVPDQAAHTTVRSVFAPPAVPASGRWHQNQLADVTVFTDVTWLRNVLDAFFKTVDDPEVADLIVSDVAGPGMDYTALKVGISASGAIQLWDARLPFVNPLPDAEPMVREPVAHIVAALLYSHITGFTMEKTFVEVHPVTLNVSRFYYGP
jgi:hypothetical protein